MAKAKKVRKAQKPTGRAIIKEINALVDARINSGLEKLRVSLVKFLGKGIGQASKALDVLAKNDFKNISTRVNLIEKGLNKLIGKKRTKVAATKPDKKKVKKICKVKGCKLPYRSKGYCENHYQAWRRKKIAKSQEAGVKACKIKGCRNKHHAKGYCWKHYMQWRRGSLR